MNIFATSDCPYSSAAYLDDKRVVKMILESAQMLSTAINLCAGSNVAPYKSTHINHPCNIWTRENLSNFNWLVSHMDGLYQQYKMRYGKKHKSGELLTELRELGEKYIPNIGSRTPFVNCARNKSQGVDFTHIGDVHEAYRKYLCKRMENDIKPAVTTLYYKKV